MTDSSFQSVTEPLHVAPVPFAVSIIPPGSKSLTNRALVLAALADGSSMLHRPLVSDDTVGLRNALSELGATCEVLNDAWRVSGVAGSFSRGGEVNLGDGGTPARFMLAAAALSETGVVIDGSARMRERPVAEGIDLLRQLGVELSGTGTPEHLPVEVVSWPNRQGGTVHVGQTASSQFLSALMLIAPWTAEGITIAFTESPTSVSYIELTVALLRQLGVQVAYERAQSVTVPSGAVAPFDVSIEPDASSAMYWWSAAAITPGASVTVPIPETSAQPDLEALALLELLGAQVIREDDSITVRGPSELTGAELDAELCPDAAVMLAVVAACARGVTRIDGLRTLRVKETDRIHALAEELAKTGCTVRTYDDAIEIEPATMHAQPIQVKTWNDHRMAMAFGVLGLVRKGVRIEDPSCVAKSYPKFWEDRAWLLSQCEPAQ